MKEAKPEPEIYKARISDEDMIGWINTLKEVGFSEQELDEVMSGLNFEYSRQKMSSQARQVLDETIKAWDPILKRGALTQAEKENLRDHILQAEREALAKRPNNSQKK